MRAMVLEVRSLIFAEGADRPRYRKEDRKTEEATKPHILGGFRLFDERFLADYDDNSGVGDVKPAFVGI
jgi:hypothetical protein